MTTNDDQDAPPPAPSERRIAFERLRERTDELELIISGISLVALVSLPGWLFGHWARLQVHTEGLYNAVVSIGFPLAIGLSYTLAGVFLVHLGTRAYWVGLIGLKATFPHGVRWGRIDSVGPVTRDIYRRSMVDLDAAIDAADRFASLVFAVVSLTALSVLWIGGLMIGLALLSILVGSLVEVPPRVANIVWISVALIVVAIGLMIPVIDRGSAWLRGRDVPASTGMRRTIELLNRAQNVLLPQRLLLPVQLTLESNMPRYTFSVMFGILIFFTTIIGTVQMGEAPRFAPFVGGYAYMDDDAADKGLRTAYYETLRAPDDALLRVPMIPSDLVDTAYLRVFLPYVPERDNALLKARCSQDADPHACVAGLWSLSLDGRVVDASVFEAAERRDFGMRGLQGYLPMAGLVAGRHELRATWNAAGGERRSQKSREYIIPFWFAPPYQLDYAPPAAPPPQGSTAPEASSTPVIVEPEPPVAP